MGEGLQNQTKSILSSYDPAAPQDTADSLRRSWLQFEPKSIGGIKAEQRALQETIGTPVSVLKSIGKEMGKTSRKRVADFIPLCRLLWEEYGREGRIVAVQTLGPMELAEPDTVIPLARELCRSCHTWEDADQLAMLALEPVVRKNPENWLPAVLPWLEDENKWVRRAGVTVVGRLPMKRPGYTEQCLVLTEQLLADHEIDVRRAVSFAIRVSARGSVEATRAFLERHVPPADPAATWVLCDAIRSMTKKFLPDLLPVLPSYRDWAADPSLSTRDRRSVESAVRILEKAQS